MAMVDIGSSQDRPNLRLPGAISVLNELSSRTMIRCRHPCPTAGFPHENWENHSPSPLRMHVARHGVCR